MYCIQKYKPQHILIVQRVKVLICFLFLLVPFPNCTHFIIGL